MDCYQKNREFRWLVTAICLSLHCLNEEHNFYVLDIDGRALISNGPASHAPEPAMKLIIIHVIETGEKLRMALLEKTASVINSRKLLKLPLNWEEISKMVDGYSGKPLELQAFFENNYFPELDHVLLIRRIEGIWVQNGIIVVSLTLIGMPSPYTNEILNLPNVLCGLLLKSRQALIEQLLSQCSVNYRTNFEVRVQSIQERLGKNRQQSPQNIESSELNLKPRSPSPEIGIEERKYAETPLTLRELAPETQEQPQVMENEVEKMDRENLSELITIQLTDEITKLQGIICKNPPKILCGTEEAKEYFAALKLGFPSTISLITEDDSLKIMAIWPHTDEETSQPECVTFILSTAGRYDVTLTDLPYIPHLQVSYNYSSFAAVERKQHNHISIDGEGNLTLFGFKCSFSKLPEYHELQIAYNYCSFHLLTEITPLEKTDS